MARRRRVIAITLGLMLGVVAVFLVTIWALLRITEGTGLPGGQKVAIVEIEGVIVDAEDVLRELKDHLEDPSVRAVVVRINSPGGVVGPTQEVYAAIQRLQKARKPVVASLGAVAASGGYYIAAAADQIYANPGTLTGSIGVIMQLANVEGLFKKIGVEYVVVKAGRFKDAGNPGRPLSPEERRIMQTLLDDVHAQFIDAVAEGRHLERAEVVRFADGRIFSGQQAKELRMVDQLGGLEDAIEAAAKLAELPPRPRVIRPRRRFSIFDLVTSRLGLDGSAMTSMTSVRLPAFRTPLYLMD
jgi:protease IV